MCLEGSTNRKTEKVAGRLCLFRPEGAGAGRDQSKQIVRAKDVSIWRREKKKAHVGGIITLG